MNKPDLKIHIGSLELKNPILVASGTFGYGLESKDFVDINKLGGIVTKSLSLRARKGNPPPRIVETPSGMLNAIGLANIGVERFLKEKLPLLNQYDTKIIV
ncbi:MAG: dihydroorotate dehydrogenase, partial [Bacteroidetes bacterium]|nr:dihydroorotate dehydrogenase [Bacteroidota bacterium]